MKTEHSKFLVLLTNAAFILLTMAVFTACTSTPAPVDAGRSRALSNAPGSRPASGKRVTNMYWGRWTIIDEHDYTVIYQGRVPKMYHVTNDGPGGVEVRSDGAFVDQMRRGVSLDVEGQTIEIRGWRGHASGSYERIPSAKAKNIKTPKTPNR
jgi:hypothetical protein